MILFPSCSEYIARLTLTEEELKVAKEMAKKFRFDEEELKRLYEHLEQGKGTEKEYSMVFGCFIETEYAQPYTFICDAILEQRKLNNGKTTTNKKDNKRLP